MSFRRRYHQLVARILDALDHEMLRDCGALFAGGTLISLSNGEFRLSRDVDFACPVGPGYRRFRELLSQRGHQVLFRTPEAMAVPRGFRADQYGVRMAIDIEGALIKLEFFSEARIALAPPEPQPWTSVACLSLVDQFAEKLLANADRWSDDSVEARDLIDLCVLRNRRPIPRESIEKAQSAYPVEPELKRALVAFQTRDDYRSRCFAHLEMEPSSIRDVMKGLDLLASDVGLPQTKRLPL